MKGKIFWFGVFLIFLLTGINPAHAQNPFSEENLSKVKVAVWYQTITDYKAFNRTLDDVITHLKETNTNFIFRAFWKYKVIPETCDNLALNQRKTCEVTGYSYKKFEESANKIKKELPSIIISAGIPTERIDVNEYNPITGRRYTKSELWEMALDSAKWNIINPKTGEPLTKKEFQFNRGKLLGFFPSDWDSPSDYDWQKAYAYYPDITNPEFQELQLSWAKKMIDSGADAIWIDMLFAQARMFYELTKDPYHPAVREAYEAALKQIDEIHKYAKKKGKYVYVGGWTNFLEIKDRKGNLAYPIPDFDFVVNMVWEKEVESKSLSEERWNAFFAKAQKYLGNDTPILVFMDEAAVRWQDQPLGIFSQYLNKVEQAEFLEIADGFFSQKRKEFKLPIIFVYPLHGGWMGNNAKVLSFGRFKVYDALAPEFETYETIKELAKSKSCSIFSCKSCRNENICNLLKSLHGRFLALSTRIEKLENISEEWKTKYYILSNLTNKLENNLASFESEINSTLDLLEEMNPDRIYLNDILSLKKHINSLKNLTKELVSTFKEIKEEITIYGVGVVTWIGVPPESHYAILTKNESYYPINLPAKFQQNNIWVVFKGRLRKDISPPNAEKPIEILKIKSIETQNISQVKVAVLYERISDLIYHPSKIRTYGDLVKILRETNPDLVFRVWWRWTLTYESLPPTHPVYQAGHTYQQLEETLGKLKKDLPQIEFWFGAIPTQRINLVERNPITGKTYSQKETWQMALDPQKWGINFSKEKLQELAQQRGGTGRNGYFPDVTNKEFQELYLSWAKRQIDAGVNGLFLDMLFAQPRILAKITKNPHHPAVKESLKAIDYLIEEIRKYGYEKGRYIYLCSFGTFTDFPDYAPDLDFVLVTPTAEEVRNLTLDEKRWNEIISKIKEKLPKARILAMLDWAGTTNTPLGVFSQELSKEEQREFLKIADEFFSKKGIIFIYPMHGGFMGQDAKILSFGKLKTYDALAPEFETYETIKELAQSKKIELICTDGIDNDKDGLVDNEDGDCWIREGAVLGEEYYVATKYSDYIKIIPELRDIGIKTIEMFPIWEHCNSPDPTKRWAVRDFNKLDPQRGTEEELKSFLKTAHKYNIKVITMLSEWASAFPPTPECAYFDSTGDGGALYRYQIENPDKHILIKNKSGNFICHCCGYGYAPDPTSQDVIDFFLEQYKKIQNYGFDGLRLDASVEFMCKKGERINTCPYKLEEKPCPEPVEKDYPLQNYYRALSKLKKPGEVWHAESASVKRLKIPVEKNPLCRFPFYYSDTTNDEYAEISSSHFNMILPYLFRGKINSADFVKLLKKEPIAYNRARLRSVIKKDIGEVLTGDAMNFVVNDPRYFPSVVLVSTIPGVPYVGLYELFGSRLADKLHGISGDSVATAPKRRAFWKKVLNIRNRHNALKYGTIENVWKGGDSTYAYLRKYENESVIVVVNFLNKSATSVLNLSFLPEGTILHDELNNQTFMVNNPGNFGISLPAYGSRILILKTCKRDSDCKLAKCPQAYCDNGKCICPEILRPTTNISQIKVAVQYRYVTDGKVINRSLSDVIRILNDTKPEFVFQGWMTQKPCADKCSDLPTEEEREKCDLSGYSYEHLMEAFLKIKKELPDIIFCGGTQAEYLYPEEVGESRLILEPGDRDKAWEISLNPEKWGINVSRKDIQCYWAKRWGDIEENEPCPSEKELKQRMRKFFPDLTNPEFQKIFLERIYKQIDAGVDAIWIDMLYMQARLIEELTKNPEHIAVRESYKAAKEIVDKIHEYGKKKGKYIYVITWVAVKSKNSIVTVPKEYVNVDAAMVSPSSNEIKDKFTGKIANFNEELWDELVEKIRKEYGIPIFARIDYGGPGRTPLYVFSQELSKEEAREFLRRADEFFSKKGIIFIYPVHGGDMGRKELVKKLSYGKFNWYDSLAPEFETYETIKNLTQNK